MTDWPKTVADGFLFEDKSYLSFANMTKFFEMLQIECIEDPAYVRDGVLNLASPVYVSSRYKDFFIEAVKLTAAQRFDLKGNCVCGCGAKECK